MRRRHRGDPLLVLDQPAVIDRYLNLEATQKSQCYLGLPENRHMEDDGDRDPKLYFIVRGVPTRRRRNSRLGRKRSSRTHSSHRIAH